jgi:hypothetical protein
MSISLKVKTMCFSETSFRSQRTTLHYITEDRIFNLSFANIFALHADTPHVSTFWEVIRGKILFTRLTPGFHYYFKTYA